jgi:hypothetical protein
MKMRTRLVACAAAMALATSGMLGCTTNAGTGTAAGAGAAEATASGEIGATAIGPDPTEASLTASRGPYAVGQRRGIGAGFAGGTIYYPNDQSLGRMGAVVVVPGFLSVEAQMAWWGPRIASHGFVVMVIGTTTLLDVPASRAMQQNAALRWLTTSSPVANRIDPTRLAAAGWSMGGGGSLDAARNNPNIKVVVPMAPWNPGSIYLYSKPTFILSCNADAIATNALNSDIFYGSLTGEKAQLTISGSHFCPTSPNAAAARYVVAWLKRFLDDDTRYSSFVCTARLSYRNTCPV